MAGIKLQAAQSNQHGRQAEIADDETVERAAGSAHHNSHHTGKNNRGNDHGGVGHLTAFYEDHVFHNQRRENAAQVHNTHQGQINAAGNHTGHHAQGQHTVFRELENHGAHIQHGEIGTGLQDQHDDAHQEHQRNNRQNMVVFFHSERAF